MVSEQEHAAQPEITVIIVNYNVRYFLEQALESVFKALEHVHGEVIVVDNNSVDDSVAAIKANWPSVKLIANKENTGFSVANNQAIKQAKGEYILLLNPDTVIEQDTLSKTLDFMRKHPDAGALGVKMIDGSGAFLPESKRGFPSPWVAFCKAFGLSRFFPKSPLFNRYHLGYLDKDENHAVDVLSGAFMLIPRKVLDEVGLLDETFFMYGEDIDLSYRIVKAGYKNYYFAETTIIHYKGESTRKGSLNYVKTFYKAMIIFARKHLKHQNAGLFIFMLQMAIYFKAALTLVSGFARKAALPLLEAVIMFIGLVAVKDLWASQYFQNPDFFQASVYYVNFPLYIAVWIISIYFSGAYDEKFNLSRLIRGLFIGTVLIAAIYGFLDVEHRFSRAIIVFGAVWATIGTVSLRYAMHFAKYRNFRIGRSKIPNLLIVGHQLEVKRVLDLLQQIQLAKNFIGTVSPNDSPTQHQSLGKLSQLEEIVRIYRIDEIIFCSGDVSTADVTHWMAKIGPQVQYKILPENSSSIIGSHSSNNRGELYTIEIKFNLSEPLQRRNKRLLDLLICLTTLLLSPVLIWFIRQKGGFFSNWIRILLGQKTWVSYAHTSGNDALPNLKNGVLSPVDGIPVKSLSDNTLQRLNLLYAKDYTTYNDLIIILRGLRNLGRQ